MTGFSSKEVRQIRRIAREEIAAALGTTIGPDSGAEDTAPEAPAPPAAPKKTKKKA
jgi:hypothetical protein